MKHVSQSGHLGHVPSTDVLIEGPLIVEQLTHIGNTMGIPQGNVPILLNGHISVPTPQLHCRTNAGIVQHDDEEVFDQLPYTIRQHALTVRLHTPEKTQVHEMYQLPTVHDHLRRFLLPTSLVLVSGGGQITSRWVHVMSADTSDTCDM